MKKVLLAVVLCVMTLAFSGCVMTKEVAYFQNMDSVDISNKVTVPEPRIKVNDELTILVSSVTPEAAEPFNMHIDTRTSTSMTTSDAGRGMYSYIVDKDGFINFPVVGRIKILGLTRPEVEEKIAECIKPYFSATENPVVKARFSSFKVTVIGEVTGSKVISVSNERISIVEALAQAGDLSVYGKRPNILLVRESSDGSKKAVRFNMNDAKIFNSPYYYLEQNDIIYVEPHKARARSADVSSYTFWTPISSVLISLATLVVSMSN